MARHYYRLIILLISLDLFACSSGGIDGESVDETPDFPEGFKTQEEQGTAQTAYYSDEEEPNSRDPSSEPNAVVGSLNPEPISAVPNRDLEPQALLAIAEDYFRTQTEVDISALEAPCPTESPDGCFHSDQANPEYDKSNNGIYKGVVTGSGSGHILLNIRNGDSESIYAEFAYQNDSFQVPLSEFHRSNGTYEYRFAESEYDFGLVIAEDGEIIRDSAMLYVPGGETAVVTIAKETSTQLVEVFEGSVSGSTSGLWNSIVIGNQTIYGYYMDFNTGTRGKTWAEAVSPVSLAGQFQADDQEAIFGLCFGYRDDEAVWGTWYFQSIDNSINGTWEGFKTL